MSKFYPLEHEEWTKVRKTLKPVEIVILYHLRTLEPFGDRAIKVNVTELSQELEINRSTASRALKQLELKGFLRFELNEISIILTKCDQKVTPLIKKSRSKDGEVRSLDHSSGSKSHSNDQKVRSLDHTKGSKSHSSRSKSHSYPPETQTEIGFQSSHTLHTINTDLIRSEIIEEENTEIGIEVEIEKPRSEILKTENIEPDTENLDRENELKGFIAKTVQTEKKIKLTNPTAYIAKCLEKDGDYWRSRYQESIKPKIQPQASGMKSWQVEGALISAMMCRDFEYVLDRLKQIPEIAQEILGRHPDWRQILCI